MTKPINKTLISVVVPIYNISDYLEDCVESILKQSYTNLQVILVDDGSNDGVSDLLCDKLAAKDGRIEVYHKKNGGLSDARNFGIQKAKGEYIAFIDGDDYLAKDFIKILYGLCVKNGADIACSSYYKVNSKGELIRPQKGAKAKKFTNIEAVKDVFVVNSVCEVMTWNKLYKKDLFDSYAITFPIGKIHEDNFTTYKLFYYANEVVFTDEPLYYYVQRHESIMGRAFDERRLDVLSMPKEARAFFLGKSSEMEDAIQSTELLMVLGLLRDYNTSGLRDSTIETKLNNALVDVGDLRGNKLVSFRHKVMLQTAIYLKRPYALLQTTMRKRI